MPAKKASKCLNQNHRDVWQKLMFLIRCFQCTTDPKFKNKTRTKTKGNRTNRICQLIDLRSRNLILLHTLGPYTITNCENKIISLFQGIIMAKS